MWMWMVRMAMLATLWFFDIFTPHEDLPKFIVKLEEVLEMEAHRAFINITACVFAALVVGLVAYNLRPKSSKKKLQ